MDPTAVDIMHSLQCFESQRSIRRLKTAVKEDVQNFRVFLISTEYDNCAAVNYFL